MDDYWQVGRALLEIKQDKLYRAEYGTFEAYCEQELKCTASYAHRVAKGVKVLESMSGDEKVNCSSQNGLPANAEQTRELTKADPEDRSDLWGDAVESAGDGPVTATHVKAVDQ